MSECRGIAGSLGYQALQNPKAGPAVSPPPGPHSLPPRPLVSPQIPTATCRLRESHQAKHMASLWSEVRSLDHCNFIVNGIVMLCIRERVFCGSEGKCSVMEKCSVVLFKVLYVDMSV